MRARGSSEGFSLIEALIAMAITATAFTAAMQLLMQASAATRRARLVTRASMLATSKMEELESLTYTVGDDGADIEDEGLSESPDGTLTNDAPGYCEWFDSAGRAIPGTVRPPGSSLVRRWSIRAVEAGGDALALQVRVATAAGQPLATLTAIRSRRGA
jgi:type II secretory pathway pseudopilin PulG